MSYCLAHRLHRAVQALDADAAPPEDIAGLLRRLSEAAPGFEDRFYERLPLCPDWDLLRSRFLARILREVAIPAIGEDRWGCRVAAEAVAALCDRAAASAMGAGAAPSKEEWAAARAAARAAADAAWAAAEAAAWAAADAAGAAARAAAWAAADAAGAAARAAADAAWVAAWRQMGDLLLYEAGTLPKA